MALCDYTIDGQIGAKGKNGGVQTALSKDAGDIRVTIKRIDRYGERMIELLERIRNISHPNLSSVIEICSHEFDGSVYVVRQLIEGTDLKSIFTNKSIYRRVDEHKFIEAGCAILKALSTLHGSGIVHRDIKPSNIIIPHDDKTKPWEADFSKAILIDYEQCSPFPDNSGVRSSFALVYSPPEMLLKYNSLVGPWSDLFALSVMLFQLIMGKAPYTDCNPEILVNLQLTYPMKQPARMADDLFACLQRAAHKAAFRVPPRRMSQQEIEATLRAGISGRYQSAQEMLNDLSRVTEPFKKVSWITKVFGE
ncbi:MAG: protein kinase [Marinilabiliaceae bacterium]|nr:protein kinase [Marinilabiliaceae bacterium]